MRNKLNIILIILILTFSSCASFRNRVFPVDEKIIAKKGWVIIKNSGQIINEQRQINYIHKVEKGGKAKISLLKYTREGDPLKIRLKSKNGKTIKYINYRRDRFGPKWWNNLDKFQPINLFGIYRIAPLPQASSLVVSKKTNRFSFEKFNYFNAFV